MSPLEVGGGSPCTWRKYQTSTRWNIGFPLSNNHQGLIFFCLLIWFLQIYCVKQEMIVVLWSKILQESYFKGMPFQQEPI